MNAEKLPKNSKQGLRRLQADVRTPAGRLKTLVFNRGSLRPLNRPSLAPLPQKLLEKAQSTTINTSDDGKHGVQKRCPFRYLALRQRAKSNRRGGNLLIPPSQGSGISRLRSTSDGRQPGKAPAASGGCAHSGAWAC